MTRGLATRFGNARVLNQSSPLSDEQLYKIAPSIFAQEKHDSRSERYTYIPTIEVLDGLRNEGFFPFMAAQSRTRIEGKEEYTKHMIRLRKADMITGDEANEIVLINSHDGTSSYQMLAGLFRFVCQNGMVTGDTVEDIRISHRGNIVNNVIEAAYEIIDNFDDVNESIENMKSTQLLLPEARAYAEAALSLKYDEDEAPIRAEQLLFPKRYSDSNKNDMWTTFNKVQENIMKGGLRGYNKKGSRVSTRAVNSIDNNVKLNRALWILADKMIEFKKGN